MNWRVSIFFTIREPFVSVELVRPEEDLHNGFLSPLGCNDTNKVEIFIAEKNDHLLLVARLDNLGKGASGARIGNLKHIFKRPESIPRVGLGHHVPV